MYAMMKHVLSLDGRRVRCAHVNRCQRLRMLNANNATPQPWCLTVSTNQELGELSSSRDEASARSSVRTRQHKHDVLCK